jgi:sugar O-acyltransferase (sialic acid O-acetyltransferase NeuD family)
MNNKKLYLFGYSGHALVVADCLSDSEYSIAGYFDRSENKENPLNIEYIGNESEVNLKEVIKIDAVFPSIGANTIREKLVALFQSEGLEQVILIHNSAYVANNATLGKSTMVGPKAVVNPFVKIGKGVIINTSVLIEHECRIDDFTHIAPGTVLAGNVSVGKNVFIGANSTIKEGIKIGDNVIIGAGSVVLNDIEANEMWAGVPAKKIKNIE